MAQRQARAEGDAGVVAIEPPAVKDQKTFQEFLEVMCKRATINAAKLYQYYMWAGGSASRNTVTRWLEGESEPPVSAVRPLLWALSGRVPNVNVFEAYFNHVLGKPFRPAPRRGRGSSRTKKSGNTPQIAPLMVAKS